MTGLARRQFLRTAFAGAAAFVVAGCTPGHKRARRPPPSSPAATTSTTTYEGFGDRIDAGPFERLLATVDRTGTPHYVPAARAYVSAFPPELAARARLTYPTALHALLAAGAVVLYQRCTHLGCRVPFCPTSQWFECPCHDAKFDRVGECRRGPATRGLDLMRASVDGGRLVIDTAAIYRGVPVGTNTTHQAPAGPFCVG